MYLQNCIDLQLYMIRVWVDFLEQAVVILASVVELQELIKPCNLSPLLTYVNLDYTYNMAFYVNL